MDGSNIDGNNESALAMMMVKMLNQSSQRRRKRNKVLLLLLQMEEQRKQRILSTLKEWLEYSNHWKHMIYHIFSSLMIGIHFLWLLLIFSYKFIIFEIFSKFGPDWVHFLAFFDILYRKFTFCPFGSRWLVFSYLFLFIITT